MSVRACFSCGKPLKQKTLPGGKSAWVCKSPICPAYGEAAQDARGRPRVIRHAISPSSPAQRAATLRKNSVVSGEWPCDPAHLWPRGKGGCDDPLCTVPLTRPEHRAFDDGELDILPHLLAAGCVAELCHALEHARGDLVGLLNRLTGERWVPEEARRRTTRRAA